MIVSGLDIFPLQARLIHPFRTTFGEHLFLENVFVKLKLGNGTAGWGEAAIAPHITGETVAVTLRNLKKVAPRLIDQNIEEWEQWAGLFRQWLPRNPAAASALEMALLDGLSRTKGIPLWRLFGPRAGRLTTDITIVISTLPEATATARSFYRRGFRCFKVKIGRDPELDLERVLAVKAAAPRCRLLLDANQGYTAAQTIRLLRALAKKDLHPGMIEQPVPKGDWDGLIRIKKTKLAPVCVDETVRTYEDAQRVVRRQAADIINIKLMKSGFSESLKIVRLAKAKGLGLMIGGMMESALAMTAAAHFAVGVGGFGFVDLDTPFFIKGLLGLSPYLKPRGVYDLRRAKAGIGIPIMT